MSSYFYVDKIKKIILSRIYRLILLHTQNSIITPLSVFSDLKIDNILESFKFYLTRENTSITRAQFEENFHAKINDEIFVKDVDKLLSSHGRIPINIPMRFPGYKFDVDNFIEQIYGKFISKLDGEAWKGWS